MLPLARRLAHSAVAESLSKALAGCGGLLTAAGSGRSAARTRWRGAHASISNAAWVKAEVRALKAEARASKAEAEARASKAVADARASKAEAEARAAKAVADARASKAEAEARASKAVAEARAAKAEADAEARAVKAEAGAEARAVKAEAVTGDLTSKARATRHRSCTRPHARAVLSRWLQLSPRVRWRTCPLLTPPAGDAQLELTHRDLAESRSEGLRLTNTRNLRGAIGATAQPRQWRPRARCSPPRRGRPDARGPRPASLQSTRASWSRGT